MLMYLVTLLVCLYVLSQLRVIVSIAATKVLAGRPLSPCPPPPTSWPRVVVQLPVYREHRVLERLLGKVMKLDYPSDLLRVQVLDDSPDHDAALVKEVVERLSGGCIAIDYLRRGSRKGYKAGALNYGLKCADADLIAYFDADCTPRIDFLRQTVPFLGDPQVAAVQARWDHANAKHSPLTALQAAIFDGFFYYEIALRAKVGGQVLFMGTSAVWRKQAMTEVGGWREWPFTAEDLDMTYRVGSAGWKVMYQPMVLSDTDAVERYLPYKAQQRRWARAIIQVAKDNWRNAVRSRLGFAARLTEATTLLIHAAAPLLLLAAMASAIYALAEPQGKPTWVVVQWILTAFTLFAPSGIWLVLSQRHCHDDWRSRTFLLWRCLPFAAGLMWSFAFGMWDALIGSTTEFVVTPKGGESGVIGGSQSRWIAGQYPQILCEGMSGMVFTLSALVSILRGYYGALLPSLTLGTGLVFSCLRSVSEAIACTSQFHTHEHAAS